MAQNVEIKARAHDFAAQAKIAATHSDQTVQTLVQADTFFPVADGRLKLRVFDDDSGQLIFYQRSDQSGPTLSEYHISETHQPQTLKNVLAKAYGIQAQVNKTRLLYMIGRTRIHFDRVADLGDFIELEVVLEEGEPLSNGEQEAQRLMALLKIQQDHLIDVAYVDLLA